MKVPVYSKQVERVPIPGVQRSTGADPRAFGASPFGGDAFGANVGEAMSRGGQSLTGLSNVFGAIAERMQDERDSNMVLESSMKWQKEVLQFQHDPEKGLFLRRGKDAVGSYQAMEGFLSESAGRTMGELENDRQRQAFRKYTMQRGMALLEGTSKFEAEQHQIWRKATAQSVADLAVDSAAANYRDGSMVQASLDEGLQALEASMTGMGSETIAAAKTNFTTKLHTQVINRYLVDDPFGAGRYYSLVKEQISGTARAAIENAITTGTRVELTQQKADELMGKFSSESSALKWIRENYSGQDEADLVSAAKTRFSEKRVAVAEAKQAGEERFWDAVEGAESLSSLDATLTRMGISPEKKRKGLRYFQTAMMQDFSMGADYASTEEEITGLGEKFKVPEVVVRRAINEHRAVFEGKTEDLALAAQSEDDFLEAIKKQGATDAQLRSAVSIFRKVHKPVYDEARKRAEMQEEWSIRDAIDTGNITNRTELLDAATMQPKEKIDSLKKYLEDSKDPAQSYVNAEVQRRYKDAKLKDEHLPIFMNRFLIATRKIPAEETTKKLGVAKEMIKMEVLEKRPFWFDVKIPRFLIPDDFHFSPELNAWTDGKQKLVVPPDYKY